MSIEKNRCRNCNSEIPEAAKFCPKCGFGLREEITKVPVRQRDVVISPNVEVSPTITSQGDINFAPSINISPSVPMGKDMANSELRQLAVDIRKSIADIEQLTGKYKGTESLQVLEVAKMAQKIVAMTQERNNLSEYLDNLHILGNYIQALSEKLVHDLEELVCELKAVQGGSDSLSEYSRSRINEFCVSLPDILIAELLKQRK